jgi:hypothetical protein
MMFNHREKVLIGLSLCLGVFIGTGLVQASVAEEVVQGEVIKVCINNKTGAMRASGKCVKGERSTVLGGVGPRGAQGLQGIPGPQGAQGPKGDAGPKGDTGAQGIQGIQGNQGERGLIGLTGPAGTISGINRKTLVYYSPTRDIMCGVTPFTKVITGVSLFQYGLLEKPLYSLTSTDTTLCSYRIEVLVP